jgi:hypothetical protein
MLPIENPFPSKVASYWGPFDVFGTREAESMSKVEQKNEKKAPEGDAAEVRAPYEPPRIEKRRALQRATLFSGSGQQAGGIFG